MKKLKIFASVLLPLVLAVSLVLPAMANGGVDPPVVEAELKPGESLEVVKYVTTPPIPPNPDIYFMSDTTGSMGPVIAAVQANADAILAAILAVQPSAQFGVGNYKDFPGDPPPVFYHQQDITDDTSLVSAAIGTWAASGGGDGPESQFYALDRLADGTDIGWRSGPNKIVVWFGDAPAHDPVPMAATGLGYDITEATVTADLVAAGIKVIAISIDTGYYDAGLDDDPMDAGGDYAVAYPPTVEDGSPGQASRIADATGGVYLFAATPEEAVEAVLVAIEALTTDVWWEVVEIDTGLKVTLTPEVYHDVSGATTVRFLETITVADDACNTLYATVIFYANTYGEPGEELGVQRIIIHVLDVTPPEVWCEESVNPHGQNIPGEKRSDKAVEKAQNPDGFYELIAEDNCDAPEEIGILVGTACDTMLFGPYPSGTVVKFTEAPGAEPSIKEIGSSNGQAGAVVWHITLPSEPIIKAVDASGNSSDCTTCLVPPPPK